MVADELDNLVVFVGPGVNADQHDEPWSAGSGMLPDDQDLARYLALRSGLKDPPLHLAEVAQCVWRTHGESNLFRWVKPVLLGGMPGPVHRYLAHLPKRLKELGLGRRYQMIVTPNYDVALEQAFREEGEPFDVAIYMAPGTEYAGRFVHLPWGYADPRHIIAPHEYTDFPIDTDYGELARTVIVRVNGAVDDRIAGYRWRRNLVIAEDHYIDYRGGRLAEEVVPAQILAKLRQASCLFLGYTLTDWRLRVFLHCVWQGEMPFAATHWAVEHKPDTLERDLWGGGGVYLYQSSLTDYLKGLLEFFNDHYYEG